TAVSGTRFGMATFGIQKLTAIFKYIRSRKPAKRSVRPLDNRGAKGALKEDKAGAEKLNESTAEDLREIPIPEPFFLGDKSEEPSQIEVSLEEVLEQIDKLNSNTSPGPDGITQEF
uniref:Uncharacterized protein n=1 Tax=Terrapene triunguis TaxID=2587831 RepID=A0A674J5T7_9SAUR